MAEDDEHIDVEDNSKFTEVKVGSELNEKKNTGSYSKISTNDDFNNQPLKELNSPSKWFSSLKNSKELCTNYFEAHRLGSTYAFMFDNMGNPKIIIGPDCNINILLIIF
ncbi:MAG: hypothetical protein MJ252_00230 [archaeon]|nr:hypothetical protein [archaeon]